MQVLLCAVLPNTPHSTRDGGDAAVARRGEDGAADLLARAVADGLMRRERLGDLVVEAALVDVDVGFARRAAADERETD
jgi:hypothetical protein